MDYTATSDRYRILFIARGGLAYGSQRQLLSLVVGLDRRRFEPVVVCVGGGQLADELGRSGIETITDLSLHPARTFWYWLESLGDRRALLRRIGGRQIDLIHCSYLWYTQYAVWLASRLSCPSIAHLRSPADPRTIRKCKCHMSQKVITISRRSTDSAAAAGIPPADIRMICDGVDTSLFRPMPETRAATRSSLGLHDAFVFGMVGRISPAKYQAEFIEAAAVVAASGPGTTFLLVGDVHDRVYLRHTKALIRRHRLKGRVVLAGWRDDIPQVLNSCDALVSMSGGSIMYEALACGVPVLSAGFTLRKDSTHILHDQTGMVIESRSPREVARAMLRLKNERPYRDSLIRCGLERIRLQLSDRVMIENTQNLYDELLTSPARTAP
jgi:glycosyltransferase involved in cell wall biosynthesis